MKIYQKYNKKEPVTKLVKDAFRLMILKAWSWTNHISSKFVVLKRSLRSKNLSWILKLWRISAASKLICRNTNYQFRCNLARKSRPAILNQERSVSLYQMLSLFRIRIEVKLQSSKSRDHLWRCKVKQSRLRFKRIKHKFQLLPVTQ